MNPPRSSAAEISRCFYYWEIYPLEAINDQVITTPSIGSSGNHAVGIVARVGLAL
jgi:hypothetical protein